MVRAALVVLVSAMSLPGCQSATMRVTPSLTILPVMAVEGTNPRRWNSPVAFEPLRTGTVREGMTWDFGLPLLGIVAGYSTRPFRLVIAGVGSAVQIECVSRAVSLSRNGLEVAPTLGRLPALACGVRRAGEGTLRLRATALDAMTETIEFGDASWNIHAVSQFESAPVTGSVPLG